MRTCQSLWDKGSGLDETVLLVPRNYVKINSVSLRFLKLTQSVAFACTEIGLESPVHLALLAFTNDAGCWTIALA